MNLGVFIVALFFCVALPLTIMMLVGLGRFLLERYFLDCYAMLLARLDVCMLRMQYHLSNRNQ